MALQYRIVVIISRALWPEQSHFEQLHRIDEEKNAMSVLGESPCTYTAHGQWCSSSDKWTHSVRQTNNNNNNNNKKEHIVLYSAGPGDRWTGQQRFVTRFQRITDDDGPDSARYDNDNNV